MCSDAFTREKEELENHYCISFILNFLQLIVILVLIALLIW
jgi:hypothetical protein